MLVLTVLLNAKCAEMNAKHEQRVNLKFLIKSRLTPIQCWRSLQGVFNNQTMSKTQVRMWFKRFASGEEDSKDKRQSGCPHSECTPDNVNKVKGVVQQNARMTVREIATETELSRSVVHKILKEDLKLRRRSAKFVPHILTDAQKMTRLMTVQQNLTAMRQDPGTFLAQIVTGDETWLSCFEPETKQQSSAWISPQDPRPQKAPRQQSEKKVMATVFFDFQGMILCEFLEPKTTISAQRYCETLTKLKNAIRQKRPHLWQRNAQGKRSFLLHHDNASVHTAATTKDKLVAWGIDTLPHPPTAQTSPLVTLPSSPPSRRRCEASVLPQGRICKLQQGNKCMT